MTTIHLKVLGLQVTSSCSQEILVIFGDVVAEVSSDSCTGIGRIWDSRRSARLHLFQVLVPSDSWLAEYRPSRFLRGVGGTSQEAYVYIYQISTSKSCINLFLKWGTDKGLSFPTRQSNGRSHREQETSRFSSYLKQGAISPVASQAPEDQVGSHSVMWLMFPCSLCSSSCIIREESWAAAFWAESTVAIQYCLSAVVPSPRWAKSSSIRCLCCGSKFSGDVLSLSNTSSIMESCSSAVLFSISRMWTRVLRNVHWLCVIVSTWWINSVLHVFIRRRVCFLRREARCNLNSLSPIPLQTENYCNSPLHSSVRGDYKSPRIL